MFSVLFYLLLVSGHYCLDVAIYDNLQDIEEQDFEQQQVERGKCPRLQFSIFTHLHALN
jgi:hypothetical protein